MQTDKKNGYIGFNMVLVFIQAGLLLCALVWDIIQFGYMGISAFLLIDVIILQKFFSECCALLLAWLSYKEKLKNYYVLFDFTGLLLSVALLFWQGGWGVLGGIEGAPFPATFFVAVVSIFFILVKTIADCVVMARSVRRNKR